MFYAGVGSRSTPPEVLRLMEKAAKRLAELGWTLRSGCAEGADSAFEAGAGAACELFIPWAGFRGRRPQTGPPLVQLPTAEAFRIASETHPAWARCGSGPRALHARNSHQVLGPELSDPVLFVLCWTPDGAESEAEVSRDTGGTGQAIRLASRRNIPIFNMRHEDALLRLRDLLLAE